MRLSIRLSLLLSIEFFLIYGILYFIIFGHSYGVFDCLFPTVSVTSKKGTTGKEGKGRVYNEDTGLALACAACARLPTSGKR